MRRVLQALCVIICAASLFGGPALAQSEPQPSVSILVDSSRKMGLQTSGTRRADIAGNALASNFVKHDGRLAMSLAVFGHQRRDRCLAVDVVQDLEPLRAAQFAKALTAVKPTGAAPVAVALDTVATSLVEEPGARDLVLITASTDNCLQDPCRAAAAIHARQPDMRISVIGIADANAKSLKKLRCVAKQTGGRFVVASTEAEVASALDQIIENAVSKSTRITNDPQAGLESGSENAAGAAGWATIPQNGSDLGVDLNLPDAGDGRGTIRLVARLTEEQKPIPAGLTWRVFTSKKSGSGQHKLISEQREYSPILQLPQGDYLVNAAYGRAYLTRRITVTGGPPRVEQFVLQAGGLRLRALNANGRPLRTNVTYSVLSGDRDQFGNRRTIIANVRPGLIVRLNAGIYNVISRYGDANAIVQTDVTVEPGKLTQIAMQHVGGSATFKLVARPGGEAIAGTSWSIRTPDGTEIKNSLGALPTHVLAPGDYIAFATLGGRTFGGQFKIGAGENKQIEIVVK
ncbi:MAG: hypothetical protein AAGJ70_07125 [Pseudomonadota bacterium]